MQKGFTFQRFCLRKSKQKWQFGFSPCCKPLLRLQQDTAGWFMIRSFHGLTRWSFNEQRIIWKRKRMGSFHQGGEQTHTETSDASTCPWESLYFEITAAWVRTRFSDIAESLTDRSQAEDILGLHFKVVPERTETQCYPNREAGSIAIGKRWWRC